MAQQRLLSTYALPPGALPALARHGYTTVADLESVPADELAREISVTVETADDILRIARPLGASLISQFAFPATQRWRGDLSSSLIPSSLIPSSNPASQLLMPPPFSLPHTQSAAALLAGTPSQTLVPADGGARLVLHTAPLDALLDGGLPRGHVLELSGPPQARRDRLALGAVRSAVAARERVWWVDTQNMTSPGTIAGFLARCPEVPPDACTLVNYRHVHTLPGLLILMHNLLDALPASASFPYTPSQAQPSSFAPPPSTSPPGASCSPPTLLVLSSLSFPFQSSPDLAPSARAAVLERLKTALSRACASSGLCVVVTLNLATKLVNADGSAGSFDTGAKALMVPALGPAYLPASRSYRVLVVPHSRTDGMLRLIASPARPPGARTSGGGMVDAIREEPYAVVHGVIT